MGNCKKNLFYFLTRGERKTQCDVGVLPHDLKLDDERVKNL
jgi:hypothetical protein